CKPWRGWQTRSGKALPHKNCSGALQAETLLTAPHAVISFLLSGKVHFHARSGQSGLKAELRHETQVDRKSGGRDHRF
ncbi:MAG: hypothetical protein WBD83_11375, partial [Xanthobacteraceae bacterium]